MHSQTGPQDVTLLHSAHIMVYVPTKFPFLYELRALYFTFLPPSCIVFDIREIEDEENNT